MREIAVICARALDVQNCTSRTAARPLSTGSDSDRSPRFGIYLTHSDLPCKTLHRHSGPWSRLPCFLRSAPSRLQGRPKAIRVPIWNSRPPPVRLAPAISILANLTAPAPFDMPDRRKVNKLARELRQILQQIGVPPGPKPPAPSPAAVDLAETRHVPPRVAGQPC